MRRSSAALRVGRFPAGRHAQLVQLLRERGRGVVVCHCPEEVAVVEEQRGNVRFAQARDVVQNRAVDRCNVGGRAADDAQDLRRRGLLLERLLGLVEQPYVLDRDHRLVGEGLEQIRLVLAELPGNGAIDGNDADRLAVAQHRHAHDAAHPPRASTRPEGLRIGIVSLDVADPDRGGAQDRLAQMPPPGDRRRELLAQLRIRGFARGRIRRELELVAGAARNQRSAPCQKLARAGRNRVEHRLHVGRRARDDPQDLGSRCLALERFLRFVKQAHVLDRDHRLVGEGLKQRDLLFGERPVFLAPDHDDADRRVLAQERHREHRAIPARCRRQDRCLGIASLTHLLLDILDVDGAALEDRAAADAAGDERMNLGLRRRRQRAEMRNAPQTIRVDAPDDGVVGFAQARGAFGDRIEHRLHVGR